MFLKNKKPLRGFFICSNSAWAGQALRTLYGGKILFTRMLFAENAILVPMPVEYLI